MAAKQKPQEDLVKLAGRAMTHPEQLTGSEIKRLAGRILDDQKNDPEEHAPSLASKVISKVGDLLPEAVKSKAPPKAKAAPSAKDAPVPPAAKKAAPAAKPASEPKAPPVDDVKPEAKKPAAAKGKSKPAAVK